MDQVKALLYGEEPERAKEWLSFLEGNGIPQQYVRSISTMKPDELALIEDLDSTWEFLASTNWPESKVARQVLKLQALPEDESSAGSSTDDPLKLLDVDTPASAKTSASSSKATSTDASATASPKPASKGSSATASAATAAKPKKPRKPAAKKAAKSPPWWQEYIPVLLLAALVAIFVLGIFHQSIIDLFWSMVTEKNWYFLSFVSVLLFGAGLGGTIYLRQKEWKLQNLPLQLATVAIVFLVFFTALSTPPQKVGEEAWQQAQAGNSQSIRADILKEGLQEMAKERLLTDPYASWKAGSKVWNHNWDGVSDVVKAAIFEDSEAGALCYVYWVAKNIDPNYKFVGWDRRVLVNEKRGEVNAAPIKIWAIQDEYIELYDKDCKISVGRSVSSPNALSKAIIAKWKETRE